MSSCPWQLRPSECVSSERSDQTCVDSQRRELDSRRGFYFYGGHLRKCSMKDRVQTIATTVLVCKVPIIMRVIQANTAYPHNDTSPTSVKDRCIRKTLEKTEQQPVIPPPCWKVALAVGFD